VLLAVLSVRIDDRARAQTPASLLGLLVGRVGDLVIVIEAAGDLVGVAPGVDDRDLALFVDETVGPLAGIGPRGLGGLEAVEVVDAAGVLHAFAGGRLAAGEDFHESFLRGGVTLHIGGPAAAGGGLGKLAVVVIELVD